MQKNQNSKLQQTNSRNELPAWDLTDLYQGINDPKIEKDLAAYCNLNKKLARQYKGKLSEISAADFYKSLQMVEKAGIIGNTLGIFAYLNMVTQMKNQAAVAFYQNIDEKMTDAAKPGIFYTLEINKLPDEKYKALLKDTTIHMQ